MSDGRIYVGNLPMDVQRRDLEDLFIKYGKINVIELKSYGGSAPFAFIQYDDPRDAHDAVCGRNGFEFGDAKLRVEFPRGGARGGGFSSRGGGFSSREGGFSSREGEFSSRGDGFSSRGGGFSSRGGGFSSRGGGFRGGGFSSRGGGFSSRGGGFSSRGRGGPKTRRSDFRVIVTGLPPSGSWQDLKDHMREAGDICYTDVQRPGDGVVEFVRREDMEFAVRRLDRTEFRSHRGETSFIRVYEDRMTPSGNRSRSRSRSRDRYSPQYYGQDPPPPRYLSPPRYDMPRRGSPPRRYSPPSRHYR